MYLAACCSRVSATRVYLLVSALLSCCAGEALEDRSLRIETTAGETVILPCSIRIGNDDDIPSVVEWSKEGPRRNIPFLYRQGCETFEEKSPVFRYRTNLFMHEMKNGNISLRISNVRLSDTGKYICKTSRSGAPRAVAAIELIVGAASAPRLSVVPAVGGGLTLQCESSCWFPKPEMKLLDARGEISAENLKTDLEFRDGCFNVTTKMTVQTANRIICRIHQPEINETRVTEINIPDACLRSCTGTTFIAVAVTIIISGLITALSVWIYKKHCIPAVGGQKRSTRRNAQGHNSRSQADPVPNAATEHQREIDELRSLLHNKEETIRQLIEEVNDLRSKQRPVVGQQGQQGQPTTHNSPSPDVSKGQFPHNSNPKPASSASSSRPKSDNLTQRKDSKPAVPVPAPSSQIQISHDHSHPVSPGASSASPSSASLSNVSKGQFPHNSNPKPASSASSSRPKSDNLPQHKNSKLAVPVPAPGSQIQISHDHSRPVSPGTSTASPLKDTNVVRSMSVSKSQPHPNGGKLQRRFTISVVSSNRFTVLEDLSDESKPLL